MLNHNTFTQTKWVSQSSTQYVLNWTSLRGKGQKKKRKKNEIRICHPFYVSLFAYIITIPCMLELSKELTLSLPKQNK